MTDTNHRRVNKPPKNQRFHSLAYKNGYAYPNNKQQDGAVRIGRTDYLDKSMHGWGRQCDLADKSIGAAIGNDFHYGHRGMAKAVKGAKKYVRSRARFHDNAATQALVHELIVAQSVDVNIELKIETEPQSSDSASFVVK